MKPHRYILSLVAAMMVATSVFGQEVRPAPCNYWCQQFGGKRPPLRRLVPQDNRFYTLPRGVGVVQGGNFEINPENNAVTQHFTLSQLLNDLTNHDIRIASVHTKTIPWLTNDPAFGDSSIDVLIVWPMSTAWAYEEAVCDGAMRTVLSEYPTGEWAEFLYSNYGYQDRVIILSDWELDHVFRGIGCDCEQQDYYTQERAFYLSRLMSTRQREVEEVRARHPSAKLRVMYGPQVNRYPCNNECDVMTATDVIANMPKEDQPDLILVSYWCKNDGIVDALEWVHETTGYSKQRLVVSELGRRQQNGQYEYITQQATAALQWGVNVVTVWQWRQTWCGDNGRGMWLISQPCDGRVTWGDPAPGYYAIRDLNEQEVDDEAP